MAVKEEVAEVEAVVVVVAEVALVAAAVVVVVWEVTEEVVVAAEDAKEIGLVLIQPVVITTLAGEMLATYVMLPRKEWALALVVLLVDLVVSEVVVALVEVWVTEVAEEAWVVAAEVVVVEEVAAWVTEVSVVEWATEE